MFNIIDENKSSLSWDKRQLRCRGKTSSIPPYSDRSLASGHLRLWALCQVCSHHWVSATSVLCLPRQLLYLFSFSLWEKIFFFHSAWGTALRNADLFIVHLWWMGLHERCVPLNSTKAKHSQQPGYPRLRQSQRQHRLLFPAGFFRVQWEEFALWFRGLPTVRCWRGV